MEIAVICVVLIAFIIHSLASGSMTERYDQTVARYAAQQEQGRETAPSLRIVGENFQKYFPHSI